MKEEKSGKIAEVIYFNEDNFYTIAVFETDTEQFYAVGYIPRPAKGRRYDLIGEWKVHPKYGEQFAFSSFKEAEPDTTDGILAFLSSGVVKGVGPATAAAIVKKFGENTLRIIQESPDRLAEVSGIGPKKAEIIAESYSQHREYANTVMALSEYDISPAQCMRLYKSYGPQAVRIVRENPYQLISDVDGIGFRKADKIASSIGFDKESPYRIKSGIRFALESSAQEGSTYMPKREFLDSCSQFLEVARDRIEEEILEMVMSGTIFLENLDGLEILQLWRFRRAEQNVAGRLYALCHSSLAAVPGNADKLIRDCEKQSGIELSPLQKHAVVSSLKNGVSVITGGPGTGKTTIINTILYILNHAGIKTGLAAPTGRAAKRMSETTGEDASTIHRLLEYYYSEGDDEMRFGRTEENPLDYSCIIIDEMSMVDVLLMEALLLAVKNGTRLIFVGDADQLPSVGAGNVLRDIIASETVHTVRLTDIFRQAAESMIVVNAHRINKGEYPSFNEKGKDFFFLERARDREIQETIKDLLIRRLPAFYTNCDPKQDIQVLTPTKKGLLGSVELNKMLQAVLNPPEEGKREKQVGDRIYREGDKVMQNKNDYTLEWKYLKDFSTGQGVFNGDLGIIQSVDNSEGKVSVLFDGERLAVYDFSNLDEIETAFAMTVHKSQGSEFPVVVMPVARFAPMLATRNLLYTAVTRAKEGAVLVGLPRALCGMVDNNSISTRYSGLAPRLSRLWGFNNE